MKKLSTILGALTLIAGAAPAVALTDHDGAQLVVGVYDAAQPPVLEKTQWVWGGRNYCWYPGGWHGPGYYWCGYAWRSGWGWGGPLGWNGWYVRRGWGDRDDWRWRDRDGWRGEGRRRGWEGHQGRPHGWNGHDNGRHNGWRH